MSGKPLSEIYVSGTIGCLGHAAAACRIPCAAASGTAGRSGPTATIDILILSPGSEYSRSAAASRIRVNHWAADQYQV